MTRKLAVTAGVFLVAVIVDLIVGADVPGYDALLGFVGCVVIIIGSKWLGKKVIQRPESYYAQVTGQSEGPHAAPGSSSGDRDVRAGEAHHA